MKKILAGFLFGLAIMLMIAGVQNPSDLTGVDADTLDGSHGTAFVTRVDATYTDTVEKAASALQDVPWGEGTTNNMTNINWSALGGGGGGGAATNEPNTWTAEQTFQTNVNGNKIILQNTATGETLQDYERQVLAHLKAPTGGGRLMISGSWNDAVADTLIHQFRYLKNASYTKSFDGYMGDGEIGNEPSIGILMRGNDPAVCYLVGYDKSTGFDTMVTGENFMEWHYDPDIPSVLMLYNVNGFDGDFRFYDDEDNRAFEFDDGDGQFKFQNNNVVISNSTYGTYFETDNSTGTVTMAGSITVCPDTNHVPVAGRMAFSAGQFWICRTNGTWETMK